LLSNATCYRYGVDEAEIWEKMPAVCEAMLEHVAAAAGLALTPGGVRLVCTDLPGVAD
jgi:hypothetical protein